LQREDFLKELTILYVEDEEYVREEIEDMLSIKVSKLITAANGQEALDIFRSQEKIIDIIITDIQMPVMDGLELIQNIRQTNQDIPIIITTAFNEVEYLKQAVDLHVDKYITKPIDIVQLLKVMNRASVVIEQKKQIMQRDLVIQTILDMKPYYSVLVDKNNIAKFANEILVQLNFNKQDILEVNYKNDKEECGTITTIEKLFEKILSLETNPNEIETICLKNKTQNSMSYFIKPYFFDTTDLFMLSFFESSKTNQVGKCFECMDMNPSIHKR